MGEMGKLKQYTLDTNVFRHETSKTGDANLRKTAKNFWRRAKHKIVNGDAILLAPKEVIRELEIQSTN